jgi:hypothetical protein
LSERIERHSEYLLFIININTGLGGLPECKSCFTLLTHSFWLHHALQRMPFGSCGIHHLIHLGFRNFMRVHTANANPGLMHGQHDPDSFHFGFPEEPHQHIHHEIHRRVIVVQDQHLEQWWLFCDRFRPGFGFGSTFCHRASLPGVAVLKRGSIRLGQNCPDTLENSVVHDFFRDLESNTASGTVFAGSNKTVQNEILKVLRSR